MKPVQDHFSDQAADYRRHRPGYPDRLFDWLAEVSPARERAWDCGAGSGQATGQLADRFSRVVASDASPEQLGLSPAYDNVEYRVARAEASGLSADSVDLVTVAQALHWFDLDAFYAEARRVLRPRGVIAAWTYQSASIEGPAGEVLKSFEREVVGPYWPPERRLVDDGYSSLSFPFAAIEPVPGFTMEATWPLPTLVSYVGTWSATRRCMRATGADPVVALAADLAARWGRPESPRVVTWPLRLRVGRR